MAAGHAGPVHQLAEAALFLTGNSVAFSNKKIIAGLGWVAISKYVNRLLGFVTTMILAKFLVPEDFGLVALAAMMIEIIKIFKDMGLGQALIYRKDRIEEASSAAFFMTLGLNTTLFLLTLLLAPLTASFFEDSRITTVLIVLSTNLLWMSLGVVPSALVRKEIDFHKLIIPEVAPVVVGSIVGITMAYKGYGVWSLVVRALVVDILYVILLWRIIPFRPRFNFNREIVAELLHYGKFIVGTSIFAVVLYNIDKFYISKIIGLAPLGIYTLAFSIANMPVTELGHLICRVMFPVFSRLNSDLPALRQSFEKTFRFAAAVTFPMAIGIITFGPGLVDLMLDAKWAPMKGPLQVLALAALMRSLSVILHELIRAMGHPKRVQTFVIYRLILVGGLGAPAVIYFGLEGICWLIAVTYFSVLLWEATAVHQMLSMPIRNLLRAVLPPMLLAAISIPAVYWLLDGSFDLASSWAYWMLGVVLASLAYLATLLTADADLRGDLMRLLPDRAGL